MTSFNFPKIFSGNRVKITSGNEATLQNLRLILLSKMGEFFGDPDYGTKLVEELFQNGNTILTNIVKDYIYTTIVNYIPQLTLGMDDITLTLNGSSLIAEVNVYNNETNEYTLYNLDLLNSNTNY